MQVAFACSLAEVSEKLEQESESLMIGPEVANVGMFDSNVILSPVRVATHVEGPSVNFDTTQSQQERDQLFQRLLKDQELRGTLLNANTACALKQ